MDSIENQQVNSVFEQYPAPIRNKLLVLRQLILETASESDDVIALQETLKRGQPSYVCKRGSILRLGWAPSAPAHYAMYFHCQMQLVDTFRALYADKFCFQTNRAIVFHDKDKVPVNELKHCILLTLTYHKFKHLPLLGAVPCQ